MSRLLANIRMALRALGVNKLRSLLTMLGIMIGVGAVIVMVAVGAGARARVQEQIRAMGSNVLLVVPGAVTTAGVRLPAGSWSTLVEEDAYAIRAEVPGVAAAAPMMRANVQLVSGNANWNSMLYATTLDFLIARDWEVTSGRTLTREESEAGAKVVILGRTVAEKLFGDEDPIDRIVRVNRVPLQVIGVLDRRGQSTQGQDQDDNIVVPLITARNHVIGSPGQVRRRSLNWMLLKAEPGADLGIVQDLAADLLRQRHRIQANQDDDFSIRNLADVARAEAESGDVFAILLAAIASVSLLVGGIGIMNIMLVSVTERTREIGLRMAIGARARDILSQFLTEAVLLSLLGGAIGIVIGIGTALAVGRFAGWRIELQADAVVLAAVFSAAVGIFFGFYPARKASRLQPIEALRYE